MNSPEAKKVLAAYLAGHRVTGEDLWRALAAFGEDQTSLGALAEELTGGGHPDECATFRDRMAEFSEISRAEREREAPEMTAHLRSCASCRQDYWEIAPLWRDIGQAARLGVKQLGEGIRLAFSRAGRLVDTGWGPPARDVQLVGTLSSEPEAPPEEDSGFTEAIRKEWSLHDEDAHCRIHLALDCLPSGRATLSCRIEADLSSVVEVESAEIEIREAESRRRIAAGPLAGLQSLDLEPCSCLIRLQAAGRGKIYAWEIPLTIEALSDRERVYWR
jgi:hypothetical protein